MKPPQRFRPISLIIAASLVVAGGVALFRARTQIDAPVPFASGETALAPTTADQEWSALQALRPPQLEALPADANAAARAAARQRQAGAFVDQADKLKMFYTKYPNHAQAGEARGREAKALLRAERLGDEVHRDRVALLIEAVRRDSSVPATKRCEIVGMSKYQDLQLFRLKGETQRLAAVEQVERSLIQEFPSAPNGYEVLLQVARYSEDHKGKTLAEELVGMANAPTAVKTAAKSLLDRYALNGTAIAMLLPPAAASTSTVSASSKASSGTAGAGEAGSLVKGGETIIYSWSSANQASLAFAQQLQKTPPAGVRLIGINLDSDLGAGKATAQVKGLWDPQIYDAKGEAAAHLRFDSAPLAYIADAEGKIRTVSGVRELTEYWAASRKAMFQPPPPPSVSPAEP